MKFPKKLIAFGLSLCMSVVPCGPVAAEDFTDAQTDMTDTIDTFTDDGNSEESENTVNTDQIAGEDTAVSTDQITEEEFPGSDIGTETDEAESSESEEIQQDSEGESTLEEPSAVIRKAEGTEEAAAPEFLVTEKTRSSRKIYSQMIFRQQALPKKKQMWRAQKYICMR
mgnify:CR=1 FL=1